MIRSISWVARIDDRGQPADQPRAVIRTPSLGPWQPMQGELTCGHKAPQPARVAIPLHTSPCSNRQFSSSGITCQVR